MHQFLDAIHLGIMYVCMYVCMYIYMYVYMYVCIPHFVNKPTQLS